MEGQKMLSGDIVELGLERGVVRCVHGRSARSMLRRTVLWWGRDNVNYFILGDESSAFHPAEVEVDGRRLVGTALRLVQETCVDLIKLRRIGIGPQSKPRDTSYKLKGRLECSPCILSLQILRKGLMFDSVINGGLKLLSACGHEGVICIFWGWQLRNRHGNILHALQYRREVDGRQGECSGSL
jgi:hypothetical protein